MTPRDSFDDSILPAPSPVRSSPPSTASFSPTASPATMPNLLSASFLFKESVMRIGLLVVFCITEVLHPFERIIHPDEAWLYLNPETPSYFPTTVLWCMVVFVPISGVALAYLTKLYRRASRRERLLDVAVAVLAITLLMPLNGVVTNTIKLCVGRPRPDFLYRCWPDGKVPPGALSDPAHQLPLPCAGDLSRHSLVDGRKSFPSGHSSFSFCVFTFLFLYFSAKLRTFANRAPETWKLMLAAILLLTPTCIAISRTCDYHHHWQDVTCGSLLGIALTVLVYRHFYPPLTSVNCDAPYVLLLPLSPIMEPIVPSLTEVQARGLQETSPIPATPQVIAA